MIDPAPPVIDTFPDPVVQYGGMCNVVTTVIEMDGSHRWAPTHMVSVAGVVASTGNMDVVSRL
jgi:hypothetical protein